MQEVRFWVNETQHKEAIRKLGSKAELYGFAKDAFLNRLKGVKEVKKVVWYVCPEEGKEFRQIVSAEIEAGTGKLTPICDCGKHLVRRVERVANKN